MSAGRFQVADLVHKPRSEKEIISKWMGELDAPLVSIQCMTFNHAPYIEDALKGFLMQETTFPIEIWVHDDASTDGTREIIERYQAEYPRIIKTFLQDCNQYSKGYKARYFLRGLCKGKYYAICEGDDFWISPRKLAHQVAELEKNGKAYICIHPAYKYDLISQKWEKSFYKGRSKKTIEVSEVFTSLGQFSPTASYLMLAQQYDAMPDWFFESRDLPFGDFFIEAIMGRDGILYIPEMLSVYRVNVPGSYSIRTKLMDAKQLVSRFNSLIFYTNKLLEYSSIPAGAVCERRLVLYFNYLDVALSVKSLPMYRHILSEAARHRDVLPISRRLSGSTYAAFLTLKLSLSVRRKMIRTLVRIRDFFRHISLF